MAQFANPHLDNAKTMEAELNYEEMPEELAQALAQPGNTADETAEIYRLLGMAHLALGEKDQAQYAFIKLLTIQPKFQMPSTENPRFRKAFGDIKAEFEASGQIKITHQAPDWIGTDMGDAPTSFPVELRITDKYEQVHFAYIELVLTVNQTAGQPTRTTLTQIGRTNDVSIFSGQIQNPGSSFPVGTIQYYEIKYEVVLENQAHTAIQVSPSIRPVILEVGDPNATKAKPVEQKPIYQDPDEPRYPTPIRKTPRTNLPKSAKPANQGSTSLVVTGIVVGTVLILGGGAVFYYCYTTDACSGETKSVTQPGSLEVIIVPSETE